MICRCGIAIICANIFNEFPIGRATTARGIIFTIFCNAPPQYLQRNDQRYTQSEQLVPLYPVQHILPVYDSRKADAALDTGVRFIYIWQWTI